MTGRHRTEAFILIVGNLFVSAACLLTCRQFGQIGVAGSVLAGYFLINGIRYFAIQRGLGIIPGHMRDFLPPILCLILGYLFEWVAFRLFARTPVTMIGSGMLYGVAVLVCYWLFLLQADEKRWIVKAATDRLPVLKRVRLLSAWL